MMKLKLLAGGEEPLLNCLQCTALKQMQIAKLDQKKSSPKKVGAFEANSPPQNPKGKLLMIIRSRFFLQIAFYPPAIIRQHIHNENELWAR